jgi:hypothetical protein
MSKRMFSWEYSIASKFSSQPQADDDRGESERAWPSVQATIVSGAQVCGDVRQEARLWIEGFDRPDPLLGALRALGI